MEGWLQDTLLVPLLVQDWENCHTLPCKHSRRNVASSELGARAAVCSELFLKALTAAEMPAVHECHVLQPRLDNATGCGAANIPQKVPKRALVALYHVERIL
jgi:hypothetical protein